jgi:hypothetical protein
MATESVTLATREDIDSSFEDWLTLGFSRESLDILKRRLYGRIEFEYVSRRKMNDTKGYVKSHDFTRERYRLAIVRGLKDIQDTKEHEIRHLGVKEIYCILLDRKSELYAGLEEEESIRKIMNAYHTVLSSCTLDGGPKEELPLMEKTKKILDEYSETLIKLERSLQLITAGKRSEMPIANSIVNEIDDMNKSYVSDFLYHLSWFSKNTGRIWSQRKTSKFEENVCRTEREVIKNNRLSKIGFLSSSLILSVPISSLLELIPSSAFLNCLLAVTVATTFLYSLNANLMGKVDIRKRIKSRIEDTSSPYEQFLGFVITK